MDRSLSKNGKIKEETADLRKALSADMSICFGNSQALQSDRERQFNMSLLYYEKGFIFIVYCLENSFLWVRENCFK